MKLCLTVMTALLLTFCLLTVTQSHEPEKCCFNYIKMRVPERVVKHFVKTNPNCKLQGIIIHTNKQREFCADPAQQWVQNLMHNVENRLLSTAATTATPTMSSISSQAKAI